MKKQSITINVIMNALLTISGVVFPLISFPYISRILLPEGMGKVSFATSLISYFNMFAQLGIPTYGIRACAKVRDDRRELSKTVHELLFVNVILSIASYVILIIAINFIPRLQEERLLYLVVSLSIFFNAIGIEWLYKALEHYTYITIRSVLFKLIALAAMFLLIHDTDDYVIYGGISIFASSASNILNFLNARKYIDLKWCGQYDFMRHMKPVAVFFAMSCATTIYTQLDTLLLGLMTTDQEVGYYNAAVKVKSVLVGVVTSLGAVILPRASYYVEKGKMDEFWRVGKKALLFVVALALPMVVYFTVFADECITLLAGDAYSASILPMQIITPTLLLIGVTNILGIQMLVPLSKEKTVLYSEIAGLIISLLLNALLIPVYGATGAAVGNLATEFVVLLVQMVALRKQLYGVFVPRQIIKMVLAIFVGVGVALAVKSFALPTFMALIVSATGFFGVYCLIVIPYQDWMKIYQAIREKCNSIFRK